MLGANDYGEGWAPAAAAGSVAFAQMFSDIFSPPDVYNEAPAQNMTPWLIVGGAIVVAAIAFALLKR